MTPGHRHRSRWRTVVLPIAAAALIVGLVWTTIVERSSGPTSVSSSPSCALVVDFGGNRYIGYGAPPLPYTVGERLGTVQVGPCRDTGPDTPAEASETATLFRIDGLDPTDGLAISWDGAPGSTDLLAGQDADGGITPGFQAFLEAHGR